MGGQRGVRYISPDLNTHSVAYFFEAALQHRSRDRTHVTCYYAAKKEDSLTRRLRGLSVRCALPARVDTLNPKP